MKIILRTLIVVEATVAYILPVLCAVAMIFGVLGALLSGPILIVLLWMLLLTLGWSGLLGISMLLSVVLGSNIKYNPRKILFLLGCGITAWGYFSYETFFGAKDLFAYIPLITFPITLHFMYLGRNHLALAFENS
jgi:hypothetical protein